MSTHADKKLGTKSKMWTNSGVEKKSRNQSTFQFVDNRPEAQAQRKRQELANNSFQISQLRAFQEKAGSSLQTNRIAQLNAKASDNPTQQLQPIQKKENKTGLPDDLKSGAENLSGMSLDSVKVHYNSNKPTQLQAHAYAQGSDIHLGVGQEKHLPHEAWHVVQQKQGRVKPTLQMKGGVNVNDNAVLEKEADMMGQKALQLKSENINGLQEKNNNHLSQPIIQRQIGVGGASPKGFNQLSKFFVDTAIKMGGEVAEMMQAFKTDDLMQLYLYGIKRPAEVDAIEGLTTPSIKLVDGWKRSYELTDEEWRTLPRAVELRIDLHIYYTGDGLDEDHSKHFYTLIHEFAVHARPFYEVFKRIRRGEGPRSKEEAATAGRHAHLGQQHDDMAAGNNEFYETMYSKSLELIRGLELTGENGKIKTSGLVEQRDIDKYTQKLALLRKTINSANAEIKLTSEKFKTSRTKEDFILFHQSLLKHVTALNQIKEDWSTFRMMFELWPQLVKVFPPEQQFISSKEAYAFLLPKIKHVDTQISAYSAGLEQNLKTTTQRLSQ